MAGGAIMTEKIHGVVQNGCIVPDVELPEGTCVVITIAEGMPEVTPELQAEFDAWNGASDQALELVERLANEQEASLPHVR
jgi:hypothetical protein